MSQSNPSSRGESTRVDDAALAQEQRESERGILSTSFSDRDSSLVRDPLPPGVHPILGDGRDGLIFVPESDDPSPRPALVFLHGVDESAHGIMMRFKDLAEELNLILIAPESRGRTWDVIQGGYGPDVRFIDRALGIARARLRIAPSRVAIGGFSDGASYALSLGVTNGGLFSRIIAFSPGFAMPTRRRGEPRLYISHGRLDRVLDIDQSSRRLVPAFESAGFDLVYREFAGGHTIPATIAEEALRWAAGRGRIAPGAAV